MNGSAIDTILLFMKALGSYILNMLNQYLTN